MIDWRKKLENEIAQQGREMKQLSLDAGLGETYVRDALKRGRGKLENLFKVAELLGYPPEWLTSDTPMEVTPPKPEAFKPLITPGSELVGVRDFPIYAAAQGGTGHQIINFEPVEVVKRPSVLDGVKGAYGILIHGDSMAPAYRWGDMALINPHMQPARDEVHVFYDHGPNGEAEAIIKNLTGWNDRVWKLEQYRPAERFEVDRVDWPICHRVVGRYNRR